MATVTLQSYTHQVCKIVRLQPKRLILVGHSMGGIVITQAAEECPTQVAGLVYLCAFLPRNGDSLMTWASQDKESMVNPSTTEPQADGTIRIKPEFTRDAFYGNCADIDVAFAQSRLVPQSPAPFTTPVKTMPERWGRIPRYYIECSRDRAITLMLQRKMQEQSPCRQTFSIETDHSPFFSAPEQLADYFSQIGSGEEDQYAASRG